MTHNYEDWEDNFHLPSMRELVNRHFEEYQELIHQATRVEIDSLESTIRSLKAKLKSLKDRNPDDVNVPALQETVRILMNK